MDCQRIFLKKRTNAIAILVMSVVIHSDLLWIRHWSYRQGKPLDVQKNLSWKSNISR